MMKLVNETKVVSYKLVLQNEGIVSFRKAANAMGSPIVKNHEYLNINSTDYCVSSICYSFHALKIIFISKSSLT